MSDVFSMMRDMMRGEIFSTEHPGRWRGEEGLLAPSASLSPGGDVLVRVPRSMVDRPSRLWLTLEGTDTVLGSQDLFDDMMGFATFPSLHWSQNFRDLHGMRLIPFASYPNRGVWRGLPLSVDVANLMKELPEIPKEGGSAGVSVHSTWKLENGQKITTTTKKYSDGRTETTHSVEPVDQKTQALLPGTHVTTKWKIENGKKYITTTTTFPDGRTETSENVEDVPEGKQAIEQRQGQAALHEQQHQERQKSGHHKKHGHHQQQGLQEAGQSEAMQQDQQQQQQGQQQAQPELQQQAPQVA